MEFETSAFEADCMFADKPCALVGCTSISAKVILGASLGFSGTPSVLPAVKVSSAAASVATILIVITVADPTAASSFAEYSTVFEVYPELSEVSFNIVVWVEITKFLKVHSTNM